MDMEGSREALRASVAFFLDGRPLGSVCNLQVEPGSPSSR